MSIIVGTQGDDVLIGTWGNDSISGGAGNDILIGDSRIVRASTAANGAQSTSVSSSPAFSPDGNSVPFSSTGPNLVPGDTNGTYDIFVKNLVSGAITLVSRSSDGTQGNSFSFSPAFSPDGTKLAFVSAASNLVAGDTNGTYDVFVKDLTTGEITRASTSSSGEQTGGTDAFAKPAFSPDGTKLVFSAGGIFIKDLISGALTLISTTSLGGPENGYSEDASFSADGTRIVFASSSSNLVASDTNNSLDIFVKNLTTGALERVSTDTAGNQANGPTYAPSISPDGTEIVFQSDATNLVAGDTNGSYDIFLKNLITGELTRISTDASGNQGNDASSGVLKGSFAPVFSPDGSKVAFLSTSSNLVPDDVNNRADIFIKDLSTGAVTRVSTNPLGIGDANPGIGSFAGPVFSADQTKIAFESSSSDLVSGDTNNTRDIFVASLNPVAGNDTLIGGPGIDLAVFSGPLSSYTITRAGVVTVAGPDGTDTLTGIEAAVFDDTIVSLGQGPTHTDFNSDLNADLLWQNTNGTAVEWLMSGTTFISGGAAGPNPGSSWHVKGAADFNGDGNSDILWQNTDGTPAVWYMNGTTLLGGGVLGFNPGPAWHVIGSGDFNGDGFADILWQKTDGTPAIWLMNGTTIVSGASLLNPGAAWHVMGAGDFDGDGKSDILWQHDDGTAVVWLMNGTNFVSGGAAGPNPGSAWHVKSAGDFNGDGKSDILWQHDDGTPVVWHMNGTTFASGAVAGFNPGSSWHVAGAGDFDGNGRADIEWQNSDGTPAIWIMNDTSLLLGASYGNPGSDWHMITMGS